MKVLVASFQFEACDKSTIYPDYDDFEYAEGNDIFNKLVVKSALDDAGIECIPSIYASAVPGGRLPIAVYDHYKNQILDTARQHPDVDGVFIYFHGSMEVEKIGSGELQLVKELRDIIGLSPIVSVVMDLHANIHVDLIPLIDIVCGYKTAPHTDQSQTQMAAIELLIHSLKTGIRPITKIIKVPMLLMGDAMITAQEPLKSLIAKGTEFELEDDVFSVNLFFSHMWVDAPNTCASVVVTARNSERALEISKIMANDFWETRTKYHILAKTGSVEECVRMALQSSKKNVFISDSGDNTTAGAEGNRLDIFEILYKEKTGKRICVSGITGPEVVFECQEKSVGDNYLLIVKENTYETRIIAKKNALGWTGDIIGKSVTLRINNIDIIFTEKRSAFISEKQFLAADVNINDYALVVVKLGYLFAELVPFCDEHLFALSDGSSCVDINRLGLKRINRPMYPLDKDFTFRI